MRKYEDSWIKLKTKKVILAQVTTSDIEKVLAAHANTFLRGIQKEKYLDTSFRSKYPNAVLTSSIDPKSKQVRVELDLKSYNSVLQDL